MRAGLGILKGSTSSRQMDRVRSFRMNFQAKHGLGKRV